MDTSRFLHRSLPRLWIALLVPLLLLALATLCGATAQAAPVAPAVAAGAEDSLAVNTDGTLWSWGSNRYGALGLGDRTPRTVPTQVGAGTDWARVVMGGWYGAAVKQDGTLWTWGMNELGQLGLGDSDPFGHLFPTRVGAPTDHWISVSCGFEHTVAVKTDGTLWAWGSNGAGQLGLGDTANRHSPVQVGAGNDWASVACGGYHTVAIKTDGTLWAWGMNDSGQLGLGDSTDRSSPVQVGSASNWASVNCGKDVTSGFTVALKSNGSLWTWGYNADGQLGLGTTVQHKTPTHVGSATDWHAVSAGLYGSIALKEDGTIWAWGMNVDGQLGSADSSQTTPLQLGAATDWATVCVGHSHTLATKTSGTIWTWGANWFGQLGIGYPNVRCSPNQVGTAVGWKQADASLLHGAAVRTDGTLWTWGSNAYGELGLDPDTVATAVAPVQVGSGTNWESVACGDAFGGGFTVAVKQDGSLWAWGRNNVGQLGLGDTADRSSPEQLGSATNWASVACGDGFGGRHTLAVKTDGTLWAWGQNDRGQLGLGDTTNRHSPVQVGADTHWAAVACGSNHSFALKTDGTLWAWGSNGAGQLGLGDAADRHSPVQVGADTHWASVTCGSDLNDASASGTGGFTLAVKTSGELWSWGSNSNAQLGRGWGYGPTSPQRVGLANDWAGVAGGSYLGASIARKQNGTLWATGEGLMGILGVGDYSPHTSFTQIHILPVGIDNDWTSVACGQNSFAVKADGTLWTWGNNKGGQLGLGDPLRYPNPTQMFLTMAPDSTPPVVSSSAAAGRAVDSRAGGWLKKPVTVKFKATDAVSGVSRVQYSQTNGVSWTTAGARKVTRNGITKVQYRAFDRRGNVSLILSRLVKIDRLRPKPLALAVVRVKRSRTAALPYKIKDVSPCTVRIVIKNARGVSVRQFTIRGAAAGKALVKSFRCKLAKGVYRWYVYATDSVGYKQLKAGSNKLIVW